MARHFSQLSTTAEHVTVAGEGAGGGCVLPVEIVEGAHFEMALERLKSVEEYWQAYEVTEGDVLELPAPVVATAPQEEARRVSTQVACASVVVPVKAGVAQVTATSAELLQR